MIKAVTHENGPKFDGKPGKDSKEAYVSDKQEMTTIASGFIRQSMDIYTIDIANIVTKYLCVESLIISYKFACPPNEESFLEYIEGDHRSMVILTPNIKSLPFTHNSNFNSNINCKRKTKSHSIRINFQILHHSCNYGFYGSNGYYIQCGIIKISKKYNTDELFKVFRSIGKYQDKILFQMLNDILLESELGYKIETYYLSCTLYDDASTYMTSHGKNTSNVENVHYWEQTSSPDERYTLKKDDYITMLIEKKINVSNNQDDNKEKKDYDSYSLCWMKNGDINKSIGDKMNLDCDKYNYFVAMSGVRCHCGDAKGFQFQVNVT